MARGPGLLDPDRRASGPAAATLAGLTVGRNHPVAVVGALNVSPESFYGGSVHHGIDELVQAAGAMVEAGAAILDVGARSTAPYLPTEVSEGEERDRLVPAVRALVRALPVPVSADTTRAAVARAALDAGARIVNDVSGLRDPGMAGLVRERGAGLILMASPSLSDIGGGVSPPPIPPGSALRPGAGPPIPPRSALRADAATAPMFQAAVDPVATVCALLEGALARARAAGVDEGAIVVDPGIGFFRDAAVLWHEWDVAVLANLAALDVLGRPVMIAVSRKSFLGAITGRPAPADRLAGSLAATAAGVLQGASLVRTHDVAETIDAVRVAERLRRAVRP